MKFLFGVLVGFAIGSLGTFVVLRTSPRRKRSVKSKLNGAWNEIVYDITTKEQRDNINDTMDRASEYVDTIIDKALG